MEYVAVIQDARREHRTSPGARPGAGIAALAGLLVLLAGCASPRPMMPTPALYALGIEEPYADTLPADLRTTNVEILYATDRVPEPREDGQLNYGAQRDPSLAVGRALVDIGGDAAWEELARDARSGVRSRTLDLGVVSVEEGERTPDFPLPYTLVDDVPVIEPAAQEQLNAVAESIHRDLLRNLEKSPRKEILLFVHGVANSFDDALFTTAELWHYMGREFVPMAYTWPAGHSGLLRGYTYDRESSEFTVFHFKSFLNWLGQLPEVEGIHIIAHSRGTDVVTTGIRELVIAARAAGKIPREHLKLKNVVLAAPDINLQIAMQRTATEYFATATERLTFYTSPRDKAIGIAEFLFGGGLRIGQAGYSDVSKTIRKSGRRESHDQAVIQYQGKLGGAFGHNYFRTNPAVSSDLILTVRYGRHAGADGGRPLQHKGGIFWSIDDNYLQDLANNRARARE